MSLNKSPFLHFGLLPELCIHPHLLELNNFKILRYVMIQGTKEWLEARKSFVTATDASCILGINPWKSAYALWRQKMDLDPPEKENYAMRRGTLLEVHARQWLETSKGIYCEPKVVIKDFMMASLDGFSSDQKLVVEIKCGQKSFAQAEQGEIASYYNCQLQHQMHCAEVDQSLYVAFNGEEGIVIPVKRDQKFINEMIEKEKEFYECLISFTPPKMTTKDYQARSDAQWSASAKSYRNAYQELKRADQELKRAELLEQTLKNELIQLAGSQSSEGAGIRLSKIPRRGAVDYSKIKEIQGLDLEQYRKSPIEYWKISINE